MQPKHSVLLVEDNDADAALVRVALRREGEDGFRMQHVRRLSQALDQLGREPFDALILDLRLPDADANTTFGTMLASANDVPIVVLTGLEDAALGARLVRQGAQDYLVKGEVTGRSLVRAVRHAIERRAIGRALEQAQSKALTALAAKSEFVAEFSHEVRTPLHAILGMAEILSETKLDAEQAEFARVIGSAARRLLTYMNDALDAARLEAGRLELERRRFDLADEVRQTIELLTPLATRKGLTLVLDVAPNLPSSVVGDPGRLRHVLVNLIGNALKFTQHGDVRVRVARSPEDPSRCTTMFTISDTGIGIPAEKLREIFEPFTQAAGRGTGRQEGSGLGLWLVNQLVTLMGGRLWVSSVEGEGTSFSFTVRFDLPDGPADGSP